MSVSCLQCSAWSEPTQPPCFHFLSLLPADTLAVLLFSNRPRTFLPQGLCTYYFLCLIQSPARSFGSLLVRNDSYLKSWLTKRKPSLTLLSEIINSSPLIPSMLLCFPFDHLVSLSDFISLTWWVGVCFLPLDCQLQESKESCSQTGRCILLPTPRTEPQ